MKAFDTLPEIENLQIEILRKVGPEKRLKLAMELLEIEKKLLIEGIRRRHPEYKEEEIKLALIKILLGKKQFEIVYPQAKEIKP